MSSEVIGNDRQYSLISSIFIITPSKNWCKDIYHRAKIKTQCIEKGAPR